MKKFNDSMFLQVFKKPLIFFLIFSFWPVLTFFVPYSWIGYLQFLIVIQISLSIYILFSLKTYLMYLKFPTYIIAVEYYRELKRVQYLEKVTLRKQIQKEKYDKALKLKELKIEEDNKRALEERILVQKLLDDLESRKKKVL
jgi:hypothetical protein